MAHGMDDIVLLSTVRFSPVLTRLVMCWWGMVLEGVGILPLLPPSLHHPPRDLGAALLEGRRSRRRRRWRLGGGGCGTAHRGRGALRGISATSPRRGRGVAYVVAVLRQAEHPLAAARQREARAYTFCQHSVLSPESTPTVAYAPSAAVVAVCGGGMLHQDLGCLRRYLHGPHPDAQGVHQYTFARHGQSGRHRSMMTRVASRHI